MPIGHKCVVQKVRGLTKHRSNGDLSEMQGFCDVTLICQWHFIVRIEVSEDGAERRVRGARGSWRLGNMTEPTSVREQEYLERCFG